MEASFANFNPIGRCRAAGEVFLHTLPPWSASTAAAPCFYRKLHGNKVRANRPRRGHDLETVFGARAAPDIDNNSRDNGGDERPLNDTESVSR